VFLDFLWTVIGVLFLNLLEDFLLVLLFLGKKIFKVLLVSQVDWFLAVDVGQKVLNLFDLVLLCLKILFSFQRFLFVLFLKVLQVKLLLLLGEFLLFCLLG